MSVFSLFGNSEPGKYQKIKDGGSLPIGDWKRSSELLSAKGIQYRRSDALKFAKLALVSHKEYRPFGLLIDPEPSNPDDENALKVMGWCGNKTIHIGYVDRVEASRQSERYPGARLAAEFYSLYLSASDFIDVRFFLCVPDGTTAKPSSRVSRLFDLVQDELIVLIYMSIIDGKRGRFENDLLKTYATARSQDFSVPLFEEDLVDIKKWIKQQSPSLDDMLMAVDKIADSQTLSPKELWDLAELIVSIDGKISKSELGAAHALAEQMKRSFGYDPFLTKV
jgi:hypothetical protein